MWVTGAYLQCGRNLGHHRDYLVESVCQPTWHRPVQEELFTLIDLAVDSEYSKLSPHFVAPFSSKI